MTSFKHTVPNHLSFLRIVAGPIIFAIFYFEQWIFLGQGTIFFEGTWVCVYIVACLTDFFDGQIARKWTSQGSDFGKIIDPLADKILVISMVTIIWTFEKSAWLSIESLLMALIIVREVAISFARKPFIGSINLLSVSKIGRWKAVCQMIALGILLGRDGVTADFFDRLSPLSFADFGTISLIFATFLTLSSGYGYFKSWYRQKDTGVT